MNDKSKGENKPYSIALLVLYYLQHERRTQAWFSSKEIVAAQDNAKEFYDNKLDQSVFRERDAIFSKYDCEYNVDHKRGFRLYLDPKQYYRGLSNRSFRGINHELTEFYLKHPNIEKTLPSKQMYDRLEKQTRERAGSRKILFQKNPEERLIDYYLPSQLYREMTNNFGF